MKKRTLALLLTLLMIAPSVISCSESSENAAEETQVSAETPAAEETPAEEEPEADARLECAVPADLDFGGEAVGILTFRDDAVNTYISVTETTGELFNDAMFTANQTVMEELNCSFDFIDNGNIEPGNLQNAVAAGDEIYDIVYGTQWKVAPLVSQHIFANLNPSAGGYIDYEKPWWYSNYIDETEVDNTHTYFLAGDASPDIIRRSSMMILNTDLLTDIGGDVNEVYSTVLDGNWTYDEMSSLVSKLYIDTNGDGQRTEADTFGFASWTRSDVDHFMIDAGVRGCSRDADGVPYITFNNETTVKFVEKLVDFLWNNEGAYYVEQIPTLQMLANNQAMLLCEKFSRLDLIRDIDTNFTIIPVAKLDNTIESYSSLVHDDALILSIPIVSTNVANLTAVLEKLSYYYYYDVMPQYYEVILKTKYRRDSSDAASQMLDLIHSSMTTDFAYIYNYGMSNMMLSLRDLIGVSKSTDFASTFAKSEKAYNKVLSRLIEGMMSE